MYIHLHPNWTNFQYDSANFSALLGSVRNAQGKLLGEMSSLGFEMREAAILETISADVLRSSEIEGETLDKEQVRSSVARRLGIKGSTIAISSRNVEGVVEMMIDATQNYNKSLTTNRLLTWHAALFPTGRNGMQQLEVGQYRTGEMQVVSGAMGRERIHFEAPHPSRLTSEMGQLLDFINSPSEVDSVVISAIAHFWFVTIHPFDDGNGRIARALGDMLLARSDGSPQRFYSMSSQILVERKTYYQILEKTQRGDGDLTEWITWYIACLGRAIEASRSMLATILEKAKFWHAHKKTPLNDRQRKIINMLFDNFDGKLTSSKWAKINHCSADTALRDITDLINKNILRKENSGGRSTSYALCGE